MVPLFIASGIVALGCEAAWFRALGLLFGASLPATGALLAAFMAGLALGSELAARRADGLRRPLLAYALAEALVGLWALGAPALYARLPAAAAGTGPAGRLAFAFALLALPTTAMGATLPLLAAAVVPDRAGLRQGIARLYSVNLGGAVVGVLLGGYVLLPRLGLAGTSRALGALGLAVALAAAVVALRGTSGQGAAGALGVVTADPLAVALAAGVGSVSFALQVCWNRALALLLGSSAYTFALVAAVVLASLGLGGASAARSRDGAREDNRDGAREDYREGPWPVIARRCLALGITAYLGTLVIHAAPFFLAWSVTRAGHPAAVRAVVVVLVVGAPSWQVGALFPALAARYPAPGVGHAAGRALAATTLGNMAGALGAAFVAVPRWGLQATLGGASVAAVVLACAAAARAGGQRFRATALAGALGYLAVAVLHPAWDRASLSAGTYRAALYRERFHARGTGCDPGRRFTTRRVLYYREGAVGTVLVLGFPGGPGCSLYSLRIDGKAEGSVFVAAPLGDRVTPSSPVLPVGDLPTEVLAGWLPGMAGAVPRPALLVGWGAGISARGLLDAGALSVTAVELEPAVLAAARVFDAGALTDPRVTLVVDDARVVLRRVAPGSLDVIASHPSNPWVVGAASLFSREYFTLARERLRPGGRMLAWVQLYETDREAVRSLVATFVEAFPDAQAFQPAEGARDLLLLGIRGTGETTPDALRATLSARLDATAAAALARAGIAGVDALMARRLAGGAALARWSHGATVTTEDNAWLEYRVADHLRTGFSEPVADVLRGLRER